CSSLVFQLSNESTVYDVLKDIANTFDDFFVYFLLFVGPFIVVANVFAMFILSRKELRTPYNMIFAVMALNQCVHILCRDIQLWNTAPDFSCKYVSFAFPN
ncbi:hypothetical protein PMAYCL1PPCAC_32485, partial [Pristionchus mayeri]